MSIRDSACIFMYTHVFVCMGRPVGRMTCKAGGRDSLRGPITLEFDCVFKYAWILLFDFELLPSSSSRQREVWCVWGGKLGHSEGGRHSVAKSTQPLR